MTVKVKKNEVVIDFTVISEFCKAASHIKDATFIYLRHERGSVELYTEGSKATAFVTLPVKASEVEDFSAGFNRERFISLFKKMYEGEVKFRILKSKVEIRLDNIKAQLPISSPRSRSTAPELLSVIDDELVVKEITSKLAHCTMVDEDKKGLDKKFTGVLFDNKDQLRICKFTARCLFLSTTPPIFQTPYRVVVSDEFAKASRTFKREIMAVAFGRSHSVYMLKNGTVVYFALMHDPYPLEYLDAWKFGRGASLIPEGACKYEFSKDSLVGAVELISTSLGDTEHWASMGTVGLSGEDLVWRISGKSHTGVEVQEDILSSGTEVVEVFQVQKKTLLGLLGMFENRVSLCDFSASFVALSNEDGSVVSILLKSSR